MCEFYSQTFFSPNALRSNAAHDVLILEVSRSHTMTHNRKTSMATAEFETTISALEQPQICALDRATTRAGNPHT
jgi:hypothetical protein